MTSRTPNIHRFLVEIFSGLKSASGAVESSSKKVDVVPPFTFDQPPSLEITASLLNDKVIEEPPLQMEQVFIRVMSRSFDASQRECDEGNKMFYVSSEDSQRSFESRYTLHEVLGEGCVGLVKRAVKNDTNEEYAVKIVRTRDEETILNVMSSPEIACLIHLSLHSSR